MSQQGTPFGATTPLNQARISGGTFSYCPLSKANAAPVSIASHGSQAIGANRRMRSSTRSVSQNSSSLFAFLRCRRLRLNGEVANLAIEREGSRNVVRKN